MEVKCTISCCIQSTLHQNNLCLFENRCLANLSMMSHFQNNHHSFLMSDIGWDVLNPESTFDFHFGMILAKYVRLCCKMLIGRKNGPIEGREHMTFGWNCLGHNKKVCKWSLKKYFISEHYFHFLIETPKFLVPCKILKWKTLVFVTIFVQKRIACKIKTYDLSIA